MKQKIITALLAISVISVANAEVYKITTFTKAQKKKVETELSEGSGDSIAFSTNKGPLWVYIESPAAEVLSKSKVGECYNVIEKDYLDMQAKKVKCPANVVKKATKKKMTQQQIDACVDKWGNAYRNEVGQDATIRMDMLDEWESWCKAGKQP